MEYEDGEIILANFQPLDADSLINTDEYCIINIILCLIQVNSRIHVY